MNFGTSTIRVPIPENTAGRSTVSDAGWSDAETLAEKEKVKAKVEKGTVVSDTR